MKKLKALWLSLTGSASSIAPVLFACCKSTACVGVCASPIASLFGISTAGIASSPVISALEPLLIAISAVSFTVSYYSLYVLPKLNSCNANTNCRCGTTAEEKSRIRLSKYVFWIGLTVSIAFIGYFEYQKYLSKFQNGCSPSACDTATSNAALTPSGSDTSSCNGSSCCDAASHEQ